MNRTERRAFSLALFFLFFLAKITFPPSKTTTTKISAFLLSPFAHLHPRNSQNQKPKNPPPPPFLLHTRKSHLRQNQHFEIPRRVYFQQLIRPRHVFADFAHLRGELETCYSHFCFFLGLSGWVDRAGWVGSVGRADGGGGDIKGKGERGDSRVWIRLKELRLF